MLDFYLYKQRMKKNGYKIHKVDKTVIKYFKVITKNNKHISDEEVVKKLNRDFYIGEVISVNENYKTVNYGALSITLDIKADIIIGISNGIYYRKPIDKFMKQKLTTLFEVGE